MESVAHLSNSLPNQCPKISSEIHPSLDEKLQHFKFMIFQKRVCSSPVLKEMKDECKQIRPMRRESKMLEKCYSFCSKVPKMLQEEMKMYKPKKMECKRELKKCNRNCIGVWHFEVKEIENMGSWCIF